MTDLKRQVQDLDTECNRLHEQNGELNLELANLKDENIQLRSQIETLKAQSVAIATPRNHAPGANQISQSKSGRELAERLGMKDYVLSKHKRRSDFVEWSREKDPEGIGWIFHEPLGRYVPTGSGDHPL